MKQNMSQDFTKLIVEICQNILNGNLQLDNRSSQILKGYKSKMHSVTNAQKSIDQRKKIIQRGGFVQVLLSAIGSAVISHLLSQL